MFITPLVASLVFFGIWALKDGLSAYWNHYAIAGLFLIVALLLVYLPVFPRG